MSTNFTNEELHAVLTNRSVRWDHMIDHFTTKSGIYEENTIAYVNTFFFPDQTILSRQVHTANKTVDLSA